MNSNHEDTGLSLIRGWSETEYLSSMKSGLWRCLGRNRNVEFLRSQELARAGLSPLFD